MYRQLTLTTQIANISAGATARSALLPKDRTSLRYRVRVSGTITVGSFAGNYTSINPGGVLQLLSNLKLTDGGKSLFSASSFNLWLASCYRAGIQHPFTDPFTYGGAAANGANSFDFYIPWDCVNTDVYPEVFLEGYHNHRNAAQPQLYFEETCNALSSVITASTSTFALSSCNVNILEDWTAEIPSVGPSHTMSQTVYPVTQANTSTPGLEIQLNRYGELKRVYILAQNTASGVTTMNDSIVSAVTLRRSGDVDQVQALAWNDLLAVNRAQKPTLAGNIASNTTTANIWTGFRVLDFETAGVPIDRVPAGNEQKLSLYVTTPAALPAGTNNIIVLEERLQAPLW